MVARIVRTGTCPDLAFMGVADTEDFYTRGKMFTP